MTPSHTAVPDATATALIPLLPLRTHDAAAVPEHDRQARWDLAPGRISQELCQPDSDAALSLLQRAMGERNRWQADSQVDVVIASFQWSVLSVCSLPMDEYDAAAAFALRLHHHPSSWPSCRRATWRAPRVGELLPTG